MREHMSVKLILLGKSLLTELAFIWPVSTMDSLMVLKVRTFNEAPVTDGAPIRLDACHASVMVTLALLVAEDLTACVTLVPLWIIRYYCYVTAITMFDIFTLRHRYIIVLLLPLTILEIREYKSSTCATSGKFIRSNEIFRLHITMKCNMIYM